MLEESGLESGVLVFEVLILSGPGLEEIGFVFKLSHFGHELVVLFELVVEVLFEVDTFGFQVLNIDLLLLSKVVRQCSVGVGNFCDSTVGVLLFVIHFADDVVEFGFEVVVLDGGGAEAGGVVNC